MMEKDYRGPFSRMGEGLVEKYIEDLKKELEKKPDDPDLNFKLGVAYARIKKIDEARNVYKKLKSIDPKLAKELLDLIYEV